MGYTRKAQKVFRIEFEPGHEFAGLELTTKALTVAEFAEFGITVQAFGTGLEAAAASTDPEEATRAVSGSVDALQRAREAFAGALVSWNMTEEDGTATPATVQGVNLLDDMTFLNLVREWLEAIGGVGDDLGKDSGSTETSQVLSLPVELLS